jgi:lantibiotic modifying enzyme
MAVDQLTTTRLTALVEQRSHVLTAAAVRDRGRCNWVGAEVRGNDEQWEVVHDLVDASLYSGTSGIGAVLARVDAGRHGELAAAAARQAAISWHLLPAEGAFAGRPGAALAVARTGARLGDAQLTGAGLAELATVSPRCTPELAGDLIGGGAGTLLALTAAVADGAESLISVASALGDSVIAAARQGPVGLSWAAPGEQALCGLAHGASGPALALAELWAVTRLDRFADAALEAVRFERAWFEELGVWPDLRHPHGSRAEARDHAASMWCHGAIGCGLVRLRLADLLDDDACRAEAGAAVRQAVLDAQQAFAARRGAGRGVTICHGLGGTIDLLLQAAHLLDEPLHAETASLLVRLAIDEIGEGDWPSGVNGGGWAPGLMQGVAGEIAVLHQLAHGADRTVSWLP